MNKGIYGFIWRYSKRQQLLITLITVASFPFLYMSLELPKIIVNDALSGDDIQKTLAGVEFGPIGYLLALCAILFGLLVINAGFLMAINTYKNLTSERMTRRLRYMVYQRILRFPLPHFQRVSQGELSTMIAGGLIVSEAVMMGLGPTLGRQKAHDIVYDVCRQVVATGKPFLDMLAENKEIAKHMNREQLAPLVDPANYLGLCGEMVDNVLSRQGKSTKGDTLL